MRWRKLGLLWAPDGRLPWAKSHAMLPTPIRLPDGRLRILLGICDTQTVARVGWIDLDEKNPSRVMNVAQEPLLDIGAPGHFDDNGVNPCCAVPMPDGSIRLYYVGYQLQRKIPYTLFTGLAHAPHAEAPFQRLAQTPILDRGPFEPFFRTAPFVRPRDQASGWEAWYIGGGAFENIDGRQQPRYSLRYATSADGITWPRSGKEVLVPQGEEIGFGRPWVMKATNGEWWLWYSVRSARGYRLGYAVSSDGQNWQRRDEEVGIHPSPGEWDGEMICYGAIEQIGGDVFLFYNGSGYGRTGVGLAVLEEG
jgi:hypothetical protein